MNVNCNTDAYQLLHGYIKLLISFTNNYNGNHSTSLITLCDIVISGGGTGYKKLL